VVFSFDRLNKSPKKIPAYFDHIDRVEASGKHSVTFFMKAYKRRMGLPLRLGLLQRHHAQGGGGRRPWQLEERQRQRPLPACRITCSATRWSSPRTRSTGTRRRSAASTTSCPSSTRSPTASSRTRATFVTALRTAKLDLLETVRWSHVDELKKSAPKIQWSRRLANGGLFVALRMDQKPFDDIRVRRALNLAVNRQEIIKSYWGGQRRDAGLADAPDLHRLLRAAGADARGGEGALHLQPRKGQAVAGRGRLPERLHVQGADHLGQHRGRPAADGGSVPGEDRRHDGDPDAGVRRLLQRHDDAHQRTGLLQCFLGNTNPTTSLRKSFVKGQVWNPMQFSDPEIDAKMAETYAESDERVRQVKVRLMTRQVMEKAPVIFPARAYV